MSRAVVYTSGTFDLLHKGHLELLETCKKMGAFVIVGLDSDEFAEQAEGSRPFQSYEDRRRILRACRDVDLVVLNTGREEDVLGIPDIDLKTDDLIIVTDRTPAEWLGKHQVVLVHMDKQETFTFKKHFHD